VDKQYFSLIKLNLRVSLDHVVVVVVIVVASRADQFAFYSSIDSTPVVQTARRKSITVIQDAVSYLHYFVFIAITFI